MFEMMLNTGKSRNILPPDDDEEYYERNTNTSDLANSMQKYQLGPELQNVFYPSTSQSIVLAVYNQQLFVIQGQSVITFSIGSSVVTRIPGTRTLTGATVSYNFEGTAFQIGKDLWYGSSRSNPQMYRLDLDTLNVNVYPSLPAFQRLTAFVFENKLYMIGGRNGTNVNTTTVLRRDIDDYAGAWEQFNSANANPKALIGGSAYYINGEFWCMAGAGANAGGSDTGESYNIISKYNPTTNTFSSTVLAGTVNNQYHLPMFAYSTELVQLTGNSINTFNLNPSTFVATPWSNASAVVSYHNGFVQAGNIGFYTRGYGNSSVWYMRLR